MATPIRASIRGSFQEMLFAACDFDLARVSRIFQSLFIDQAAWVAQAREMGLSDPQENAMARVIARVREIKRLVPLALAHLGRLRIPVPREIDLFRQYRAILETIRTNKEAIQRYRTNAALDFFVEVGFSEAIDILFTLDFVESPAFRLHQSRILALVAHYGRMDVIDRIGPCLPRCHPFALSLAIQTASAKGYGTMVSRLIAYSGGSASAILRDAESMEKISNALASAIEGNHPSIVDTLFGAFGHSIDPTEALRAAATFRNIGALEMLLSRFGARIPSLTLDELLMMAVSNSSVNRGQMPRVVAKLLEFAPRMSGAGLAAAFAQVNSSTVATCFLAVFQPSQQIPSPSQLSKRPY